MENLVGEIIVEKEFDFSIPCCRYKATGEIFEYFVYKHSDYINMVKRLGTTSEIYPKWYDDSLDLVDGDMVINHEGKGYVRGNKNNAADLETVGKDYEVVPSIDRMFQYLDHR